MLAARLVCFLAGAAFADLMAPASVAPSSAAVASSTAPTLSPSSTSLLVVPEVAGSSVPVSAQAPPKRRQPAVKQSPEVVIERDAASWEPYPVRRAPKLSIAASSFTRLVRRTKIKAPAAAAPPADGTPVPEAGPAPDFLIKDTGMRSKASAAARLYRVKDRDVLVISVYPDSLKPYRTHLEVRYTIDDGFLERAHVSLVMLTGPGDAAGDSFMLRKNAVVFDEVAPSGAKIAVVKLQSAPGAFSLNIGEVKAAEFGIKALGRVNFRYSVKGVSSEAEPSKSSRPPRRP